MPHNIFVHLVTQLVVKFKIFNNYIYFLIIPTINYKYLKVIKLFNDNKI